MKTKDNFFFFIEVSKGQKSMPQRSEQFFFIILFLCWYNLLNTKSDQGYNWWNKNDINDIIDSVFEKNLTKFRYFGIKT